MKRFKILILSISMALSANLIVSNKAHAAFGSVPTAGVAVASFGASAAVTGTGGTIVVTRDDFWGTLIGGLAVVGGVGIGLADPPAANFFSGTFTYHYDSSLMKVLDFGWLGSWGIDPTLPAPPTNPDLWDGPDGNGTVITLQEPNPDLSVNIVDDPINGLLTVSFDWGVNGHPTDSTEPFNFFGVAFEFIENATITYLGDFAQPPSGTIASPSEANFFIFTEEEFTCTIPTLPPPEDKIIRECGESETSYYRVTSTPVPESTSTISILTLGILGAGATLKRKLKSANYTEKETTKVG